VVSAGEVLPLFSWRFELPSLGRIKDEDYVTYTSQLASMLAAGIPLSASLDTLVEQTENSVLRGATARVVQDVRGGEAFADAMRKHPRVFPNLFVNMVAAGEIAGNLEEVLTRLSSYMERSAEFRQKVLTALYYPIVLIIFSAVVVVVIIMTVLPTFVKMFLESHVPLPLPTQILYSINLFFRSYWQILLTVLFLAGVAFNFFSKTKIGKATLDRLALDLPFWGPLTRKVNIARFSRTLASLLSSGVPMLQSLKAIVATTDNTVFKEVADKAHNQVSKGGMLAEQLRASGEFPPMPVKMVAVGEETGKLDQMLSKVADLYEMSVDYAVKRMTSILEPILLVVIGGLVGFIFASVLLPIFNLIKVIQH